MPRLAAGAPNLVHLLVLCTWPLVAQPNLVSLAVPMGKQDATPYPIGAGKSAPSVDVAACRRKSCSCTRSVRLDRRDSPDSGESRGSHGHAGHNHSPIGSGRLASYFDVAAHRRASPVRQARRR